MEHSLVKSPLSLAVRYGPGSLPVEIALYGDEPGSRTPTPQACEPVPIDLAFLEKDRWVVIDFKTDQEVAHTLDVYSAQIGLYAAAVSRATGKESTPVLMIV